MDSNLPTPGSHLLVNSPVSSSGASTKTLWSQDDLFDDDINEMELAQRYHEDSQDFDDYDNRWNEDEIVPNTPPGSVDVSAIMRGDTSRNGDFYIHSFTYHILNTNGTLELRLGTLTRRITVLNREVIMRQDTEHF